MQIFLTLCASIYYTVIVHDDLARILVHDDVALENYAVRFLMRLPCGEKLDRRGEACENCVLATLKNYAS